MADIKNYLNLITSEHADKPKFNAMMQLLVQPLVDLQNLMATFPLLYDIDVAVGQQLDQVGKWIGVSRVLKIPLSGVYFSFDIVGVGFDQGTWYGPFDPLTSLVSLGDEPYRNLLRAKILANQWDGTISGAYAAYNQLFSESGTTILIFDGCDMSIALAILGTVPDPVTLSLFTTQVLPLKPAGVQITGYYVPSIPGDPYFGFDVQNSAVSGFDHGAWGTKL